MFGKMFNAGTEFERDGSQFDRLFEDDDRYKIGELDAVAIATPGHTSACMVHLIGDAVFVGDTLFMPDGGTARCTTIRHKQCIPNKHRITYKVHHTG